jgi:Family of unknown function (DUF6491)
MIKLPLWVLLGMLTLSMPAVQANEALLAVALSPIIVGAADAPPAGASPTTALAGTPAATGTAAPNPASAKEASIPFANHGGISSWAVVDNRTMLIQGRNRQWYKATLFSPCIHLPFAHTVGFKTNPGGSFDKFSSIIVRRQRCSLTSLVAIPPPTKKPKSHKAVDVSEASPTDATATPPAPAGSSPPQ